MVAVCDGAVSHIKQSLNRSMRDNQIAVRTPEQVVKIESQLTHHEVTLTSITSTDLSTTTLHGIKQYYKFTTDKKKNIIYVYSNSQKSEYVHRYLPRDVLQLEDIII